MAPHPAGSGSSDNGSPSTARETVAFAIELGLKSRFTPVRSPESNGIAEAFVKTCKRDYVFVHDRPDAPTVLAQLAGWFEGPSPQGTADAVPREFIRSVAGRMSGIAERL